MSSWQVIGEFFALALAIVAWVKSANDLREKAREDVDKKIDAISCADDAVRSANELRDNK